MSSRAMRGNLPSSVWANLVSGVVGRANSVLTGWVSPDKRAICVLLRNEHAVIQHVHVRSGSQNGACHSFLTLRKNEVRNSTLGIVVSPVILLIPICHLDCVVSRGVNIVLYPLMSRDLVSSYAVEELVLFSNSKAISVHPGTPNAVESFVQVLLTVLASLD